ncbi:ABC transporter permease [Nocardioidaceae bacterium]|nr:ABC transporter permease [Nocardioidaceae bacterium]
MSEQTVRSRGGSRLDLTPQQLAGWRGAFVDSATVAKRNLIKIKRVPEILVGTTVAPIMFILLFAYVFGGAIDPSGGGAGYREFLIAGIFAQNVIFGSTTTGAALAQDIQSGVIDRLRTLPMSPSAVLAGRTLADVLNNVILLAVMSLTGLLVGWRIRNGVLDAVIGFGLLLLFAYAFSWIMAYVGMLAPSPEVIQQVSFVVIFPVTFIANTFVPLAGLPSFLRTIAEWNPVSSITQAARDRFGNPDPAGLRVEDLPWSLANPELYTLIWIVIILAVFVPLARMQYRRATSR